MPKPSATMDDGIRFRGSLPASGNGGLQPRNAPPPAPAPVETRREKPARPAASAKPVIAPEATRAQAEPEPAPKAAPAPEPVAQGRAGCCPCARARHPSRRRSDARARHSPRRRACSRCCTAPERVTRPAAVAAAPNAASEADVGNKLREIVTSKQFDRVIARKPERDAIVALYQKGRSFQPLWVSQGAPSARAQDVIELSAHDRRRRPRSEGLPDAEAQRRQRGGAGRSRAEVHRDAAEICASCDDRARALQPRQPEHRLQARVRRRRRAEEDRGLQRPVGDARNIQSAATGLSGAQGEARGVAR